MEELSRMSIQGVHVTSYAVEHASASNNDRQVDDCFTVTLCYQDNSNPDAIFLTLTLQKDTDYRDQLIAFAVEVFESLNIDTHADYFIIDVVDESCEILLQQVSELGRKSLAVAVTIDMDQEFAVDDKCKIGPSTFELKNYLSSYGGVRFISGNQIGSLMGCCSICLE